MIIFFQAKQMKELIDMYLSETDRVGIISNKF